MAGGFTYTTDQTTKLATAEIYGRTLVELGEENPNVVALTADLAGSTKIGDFKAKFPERFFNVGIAEQNLIGIAAGMAKGGLIPFASSFSVFTSLRALDQVHTDVCYQNVNVKIIGTHGGTSFGQAGSTHHAIEDFAVIRGLVNMTLICPADGIETGLAVRAAANTPGPFYIRINRGFDMVVYNTADYGFEVGKAVEMVEGNDITLIACGSCVYQAVQAAKVLKADYNISARVLNMHTIKPIDKDAILKAAKETGRIITVEDHSVIGGLGSAVAEVLCESGIPCLHEDLMAMHEIDQEGIVKNARDLMEKAIQQQAAAAGMDLSKFSFGSKDDWTDEV